MNKVKKINLDTKDINSLIKSLRTLSNDLKKLPNEITYEVAKEGQKFLDKQYENTKTDQTIDISTISTSIVPIQNGYSIVASGEEVVYAEFGTGEKGADNGHPWKGDFHLNPYNSGSTIKINSKTGRHFWWYDGYSEGNPSGKQMFNTCNYLRDDVIKKIMKEKVGEVISKV